MNADLTRDSGLAYAARFVEDKHRMGAAGLVVASQISAEQGSRVSGSHYTKTRDAKTAAVVVVREALMSRAYWIGHYPGRVYEYQLSFWHHQERGKKQERMKESSRHCS